LIVDVAEVQEAVGHTDIPSMIEPLLRVMLVMVSRQRDGCSGDRSLPTLIGSADIGAARDLTRLDNIRSEQKPAKGTSPRPPKLILDQCRHS